MDPKMIIHSPRFLSQAAWFIVLHMATVHRSYGKLRRVIAGAGSICAIVLGFLALILLPSLKIPGIDEGSGSSSAAHADAVSTGGTVADSSGGDSSGSGCGDSGCTM